MKHSKAHHDIALSCVSFLNLRSKFIPGLYPNLTDQDLEGLVVTGYNGLDQYACRYWMSHVYEYVKEAGSLDTTSCPELSRALLKIASFRRSSPPTTHGSGIVSLEGEEPRTEIQSQNEVLALCSIPEVQNLLKRSLEFRQKLKDMESVLDSPDCEASSMFLWMHEIDTCTARSKWQNENDPTWLSEVEVLVANIIQKLLLLTDITIPAHISVDQIRRFKTLYSSVGLHCRYSSCKHHCVTYRSETERRKHELAHVRSYKCMECDFAERPFTSRQDLRKHQEKYHMTTVDFAIPLQIRSLAAKGLPPLRRKTQRLGARQSIVGLSPIDQTSPSDLRTRISKVMIDVHQNTQTTREYAAMPKHLHLTDTSERDDTETFGSADLALPSCTESVVAHRLESVDKPRAVHSSKRRSISEASYPIGGPIQTAPETSYENRLRIDHSGESRHELKTCNKNPFKNIDVDYVKNSTESIIQFEDGDSYREPVEVCVARYVRFAAKVHLEDHGLPGTAISIDKEAGKLQCLTQPEIYPKWDACQFGLRDCWSNFIGPYIAATFANENTLPGIGKEDTERRLLKLISEFGPMHLKTWYTVLGSRTIFLPQEMIRFERSIKLYGDALTDLPTFLENFNMWGPRHLKEYHQRSMSEMKAYLDVDEDDIAHWLYNYIKKRIHSGSYLRLIPEWNVIQDIREERKDAHPELWAYILSLVNSNHQPVHRPVGIDVKEFAYYVLSLLCKTRTPTDIVESLKAYLKPSKQHCLLPWLYNASNYEY